MLKIPAMIIVGKKEAAAREVSVRRHGTGDQGSIALVDCIAALKQEVAEKTALN